MATITKRNKSYLIRVSCGYDTNGQQIIKSKTWKPSENLTPKQIEKELNRVVVEFENKVLNGDYIDTSNIKLSEFITQYLEMSNQFLAPTTKAFYIKVIDNIIIPSLGHLKLKDIKPIHTQRFIQMLSGDGVRVDGKGNKLSPATVKRYLTVLKSIMGKAYKLELIERNPTDTSKLDLPESIETEIEVFTKEETAHMLSCLTNEPLMFQVIIHLAIVTGCRRGELVALKWNNIDFNNKTISITQSNYKLKDEEIKSKTPKTRSSIRDIAIPDYLIELLRMYHIEQVSEQIEMGDRWHNENWLFTQWDGRAIHPHTPTRQFTKFLERNDIPHRKFHALRHTSATILLTSGTNIKTVASRLGHTQLSTTNRYVHALRDADETAAQTFEALILNNSNNDKEQA